MAVTQDAPDSSATTAAPLVLPVARYLIWCGWLVAFVVALVGGLSLRQSVWDATAPVRYRGDIVNGLRVGSMVLGEARLDVGLAAFDRSPVGWRELLRGYRALYDRVDQFSEDRKFGLDYPPLRLFVMSAWAKYTRDATPDGLGYDDAAAWPLLWFNTAMELVAVAILFRLVDLWTARSRPAGDTVGSSVDGPGRPTWVTLVRDAKPRAWLAALLLWFNPAVLIEAHGWPQWDVWVLPFYLGAMLLGSTGWWFSAGFCLGVGCMFKGQMLIVAPVFVLWPLFRGSPRRAAAVLIGFGVGWLGVASPWLLQGLQPWMAVGSAVAVSAVLSLPQFNGTGRTTWIARGLGLLAVVLPWCHTGTDRAVYAGLGVATMTAIGLLFRRSRSARWLWVATVGVATVLLAACWLGGSWAWWEVGFAYGLRHYPKITIGPADNLPAVLAPIFDWHVQDVLFSLPLPLGSAPVDVTVKVLLGAIFLVCLVLCAAGAAMHDRRQDSMVLVALVAPWILLFTLNVQMHDRYLFWGAALGAVAAGCSAGLTLLHVVTSALAAAMIGQTLLGQNPDFAPGTLHFIQGTCPSLGWAVTLIAGTYLFAAVWPRPGSGRRWVDPTTQPLVTGID